MWSTRSPSASNRGSARRPEIEEISADGHANVTIRAGTTNDTLNFSGITLVGIASIDGDAGNDTITGSAGADTILGGAGADTLRGGGGADTLMAVRAMMH